jgi:hypothetical protein
MRTNEPSAPDFVQKQTLEIEEKEVRRQVPTKKRQEKKKIIDSARD